MKVPNLTKREKVRVVNYILLSGKYYYRGICTEICDVAYTLFSKKFEGGFFDYDFSYLILSEFSLLCPTKYNGFYGKYIWEYVEEPCDHNLMRDLTLLLK